MNTRPMSSPESAVPAYVKNQPGACCIHAQVEVRDYDGLAMSAQLQLDLATSIFIMPHGAGCTHAAFMQHGSVFVELVAHGVVEHSSFYHGYANVAQLAHVSSTSVMTFAIQDPHRKRSQQVTVVIGARAWWAFWSTDWRNMGWLLPAVKANVLFSALLLEMNLCPWLHVTPQVSFLKYHDVNKTLAPPRGFHCDSVIFLSEGEIGAILDEAYRVWQQQQQLQPRVRPVLINMNEPAVFDCGWG